MMVKKVTRFSTISSPTRTQERESLMISQQALYQNSLFLMELVDRTSLVFFTNLCFQRHWKPEKDRRTEGSVEDTMHRNTKGSRGVAVWRLRCGTAISQVSQVLTTVAKLLASLHLLVKSWCQGLPRFLLAVEHPQLLTLLSWRWALYDSNALPTYALSNRFSSVAGGN